MFPCIDFTLDQDLIIQQIHDACKAFGCFYISNHGISKQLIDKCYIESKKFFSQPLHEKNKIQIDSSHRGYQPFNEEVTNPDQKIGDYKEGFMLSTDYDKNDQKFNQSYGGKNKWPEINVLPHFKSTFETYFKEIEYFGLKKLLPLISKSLDIPHDRIDEIMKDPTLFLRIIHYSSQISDIDNDIVSCGIILINQLINIKYVKLGAHTDFGLCTILTTDNVPGLQVYLNDTWIDVEPKEDMFFINLGSMTEFLTNGYYISPLHRVINKTGLERYSMPFFIEPDKSAKIIPIKKFITDENKAPEPFIYREYISYRSNQISKEVKY